MIDKSDVETNVVVITGAAGLIGKAFVRAVAQTGAIVIAADIDLSAAEVVANDLQDLGKVETAYLDITCPKSVDILIADLMDKHGRIDAVVNNAYPRNANYGRKLEEVTYADFSENMNLHLGGCFLIAQKFCAAFKAQGFGNVVNMSSIYGVIAPRFEVYDGTAMTMPVEYAAIKSAVLHLTKYFAQYFKGTGIRVNAISPGGIFADQPKSFLDAYGSRCAGKGMLDPQDIANTLVFLLSDQSRYITGQNLIVDDGYAL
ncbi:oxidoreductase [Cohaesibacter gelatinilyticus]|uniref:NAD(P)-dependent dehydrogenase, short-chain alcohol dehydrogenase family n=1 Tax=Cohaesibacter gelatinilyticus TaxID=372072 RepID=A0A285PJ31_9HYPH|nr:oxidoreductase [Cohaesibacter gelatinilyticus]SNZ20136.1 NAD(P)-dependent dehydrogenase, short-chain alcohol dehydrogenase family [Cohaesibacter gelatinilyticus]